MAKHAGIWIIAEDCNSKDEDEQRKLWFEREQCVDDLGEGLEKDRTISYTRESCTDRNCSMIKESRSTMDFRCPLWISKRRVRNE